MKVHEASWYGQHETDLVLAPSSRPPRHLVEIDAVHGAEFVAVVTVGVEKDDGPGRVVHTGRHGGGGEAVPERASVDYGTRQRGAISFFGP